MIALFSPGALCGGGCLGMAPGLDPCPVKLDGDFPQVMIDAGAVGAKSGGGLEQGAVHRADEPGAGPVEKLAGRQVQFHPDMGAGVDIGDDGTVLESMGEDGHPAVVVGHLEQRAAVIRHTGHIRQKGARCRATGQLCQIKDRWLA